MSPPAVSVIIPTYNRKDWVSQTLQSLAGQIYPAKQFEVIIVDDGSVDGTESIVTSAAFPFRLNYIRQANQGDAAARNIGAQHSQAELLVFLDDDILVAPDYLSQLVAAHHMCGNSIIVGTAHLWLDDSNPMDSDGFTPAAGNEPLIAIPFANVCSNNMSLTREAYYATGPMTNLGFSGSSMWCDVDFAYRAYQRGMGFFRSTQAICWHRDYVEQSLGNRSKRSREAAYRAAALLQRHPDLLPHLPMFIDKTPIIWSQDSPLLIGRKLARQIASSRLALRSMEQLAGILEKTLPSPTLLERLSRWIVGGYLFQGYREGLRDPKISTNTA